jgi:uncharacterized membrane protein
VKKNMCANLAELWPGSWQKKNTSFLISLDLPVPFSTDNFDIAVHSHPQPTIPKQFLYISGSVLVSKTCKPALEPTHTPVD